MAGGWTRRAALGGLGGALVWGAGRAWAQGLEAIFAESGLGALTAFAVADAGTGEVLSVHRGEVAVPPASTVKILTALYALDRLGRDRRFRTRLLAGGGDLALVGGGDPLLDVDGLADLAEAARAAGFGRVAGRFVVDAGALPTLPEIEPDQPAEAGYNPGVSGLNLNFNRVFLAWGPGADGPRLTLSAPGERRAAGAPTIAAEIGGAGAPRLRLEPGREVWTLPAAAVAGTGSIWLPVRAPAAYVAGAFRSLGDQVGLGLGPAVFARAPAGAVEVAGRDGPPLDAVAQGMLRYSTNLTAEAVGLAASGAPDLAASAGAMADWAAARYGIARAALVNHSGLTARSAIAPVDLVRVLVRARGAGLEGLLRARSVRDAGGAPLDGAGVGLLAKTGTLDFVSALAGYATAPGRPTLAFAILAADLAARAAIPAEARSDPPGAEAWARRARAQENALLRRWLGLG